MPHEHVSPPEIDRASCPSVDCGSPYALSASGRPTIVGADGFMGEAFGRALRAARSDVAVMIRGESGTGKELFADFIHLESRRQGRPLIRINCACLPESLLMTELFGHAKGAFTGANTARAGIFETAHRATLFLDEIGEMPLAAQAKLLRVLEGGEFYRVGDSSRIIKVDVRIIAATNRDLEAAVEDGSFRADLYYRLNVLPIFLPALRDRMESFPELVDHLCAESEYGPGAGFDSRAIQAMTSYAWPGNVRELANAIESALLLADGDLVRLDHLPLAVRRASDNGSPRDALGTTLEELEISCILKAMKATSGNRTRAADLLGVSRRTLGYRIQKYGLSDQVESLGVSERPGIASAERFPSGDARGIERASEADGPRVRV